MKQKHCGFIHLHIEDERYYSGEKISAEVIENQDVLQVIVFDGYRIDNIWGFG